MYAYCENNPVMYVDYFGDMAGMVAAGAGLTYSQARRWVEMEQNLLCRDHATAIAIVKFYPSAIWDKAHREGYLNHYHLSSAYKNHIWYYGE